MLMKNFKGPGFSMEAPTDWYITSNPQIQVMFISPSQTDGSRANLMITVNPVKDNITVASVSEEAKKTQSEQYSEYQILSEDFLNSDDQNAFQRVYEWTNSDLSIRVHQKQVMILSNGFLYILTTTRAVGDDDSEELKRLDATMEYMLQSFRLD